MQFTHTLENPLAEAPKGILEAMLKSALTPQLFLSWLGKTRNFLFPLSFFLHGTAQTPTTSNDRPRTLLTPHHW
jgi:hypothetical protein